MCSFGSVVAFGIFGDLSKRFVTKSSVVSVLLYYFGYVIFFCAAMYVVYRNDLSHLRVLRRFCCVLLVMRRALCSVVMVFEV